MSNKASNHYMTTAEVMHIFDVSYMTVYLWREKKEMPYYTEQYGTQRHKVTFKIKEIMAWARKNKIEVKNTVE
jgi:predicted site-specific integrase-resolvase